jgi:hypothetical protein
MLQFTTWFRSPLLQMASYETLARASCTLLAAPARAGAGAAAAQQPQQLVLLASQHVTHPHAYRHYFPEQAYLEAVADADLRYSVEVCQEGTGSVLLRHRLPAALALHRHRERDVTVLALGREEGSALLAATAALAGAPLRLAEEGEAAAVEAAAGAAGAAGADGAADGGGRAGAPLTLAGHFLLGSGAEGVMLPRRLSGAVAQRSARQVFLRTSAVLEMGMCGGPVTADASGALVGIVEGLVPLLRAEEGEGLTPLQRKSRELLGGTAVIVEAGDLRRMLAQI